MKRLPISFFFLTLFLGTPCGLSFQQGGFYQKHGEGWFWYKEEPIQPKEEEESQQPKDTPQTQSPKKLNAEEKATRDVEAFKKAIEGKKNLALSAPTYENVANYMRIQQDMANRARNFGTIWQKVLLNETDLNYERIYPTAQYARHIQNDEQQKERETLIRSLAETWGLFYFFKGGCAACEGFSPIVRLFSEKYAWEVMAISIDGASNPLFDNIQTDNGMAEALSLKGVPALIAYHPPTGDLIPISYAMTSLDRLEENILTLWKDQIFGRGGRYGKP